MKGTSFIRFIVVSIIGGILFGAMDGLIHGNPLARELFEIYQPIAKPSINVPAGIVIDLVYGFAMAGLFLLLYPGLPGKAGWLKGVSYAGVAWFFRTVMYAASQWMMFDVPGRTLLYILVSGCGEMLVLGIFYGSTLKPGTQHKPED